MIRIPDDPDFLEKQIDELASEIGRQLDLMLQRLNWPYYSTQTRQKQRSNAIRKERK